MCRVDLLRARRVHAGEVSCGSTRRLEFCKRVERVVVVEIIVDREFLIVVDGMIDANLELIAAIGFIGRNLHTAVSSGAGYVLQQAQRDRIEACSRNLEVRENCAEWRWRSSARDRSNRRRGSTGQARSAARLQNIGDGRIGEIAREARITIRIDDAVRQAWR